MTLQRLLISSFSALMLFFTSAFIANQALAQSDRNSSEVAGYPNDLNVGELGIHFESGRATSLHFPNGKQVRFQYDSNGNLSSRTLVGFTNTGISGTYQADDADPNDFKDPYYYGVLREFSYSGKSPIEFLKSYLQGEHLEGVSASDGPRYLNTLDIPETLTEDQTIDIQILFYLHSMWRSMFKTLNQGNEWSFESYQRATGMPLLQTVSDSHYRSVACRDSDQFQFDAGSSSAALTQQAIKMFEQCGDKGQNTISRAINRLSDQIDAWTTDITAMISKRQTDANPVFSTEVVSSEAPPAKDPVTGEVTSGSDYPHRLYNDLMDKLGRYNPLFAEVERGELMFQFSEDFTDETPIPHAYLLVLQFHPDFGRNIIVTPYGLRLFFKSFKLSDALGLLGLPADYWGDADFDDSLVTLNDRDFARTFLFAHEIGHILQQDIPEFKVRANRAIQIQSMLAFAMQGIADDDFTAAVNAYADQQLSDVVNLGTTAMNSSVRAERAANMFALDQTLPYRHKLID